MRKLTLGLLIALLIVLTSTHAIETNAQDTSNGTSRLVNTIVESRWANCYVADNGGPIFFHERQSQCELFASFRNGESRAISEHRPEFGPAAVDGAIREAFGLTSCRARGDAFWIRTFQEDSSWDRNFIKHQIVWWPRKEDESLDTANRKELPELKMCVTFKQVAGPIAPCGPVTDGFATECETTPIVIDGDGDGNVKFSSLEQGGDFDLNADGVRERVPRILGSADGWLVWDLDGNGVIPSGKYLFGNHSVIGRANGYELLREFNESGMDKEISALDRGIWPGLYIWRDDGDFISEPGELTPLSSLVKSLSFDYKESERRDRSGFHYRYRADCERVDGLPCRTFDVYFPTVQ